MKNYVLWDGAHDLTKENLHLLFENKIGSICVKNFASIAECEKLKNVIKNTDMGFYQSVEPPIGRIGITQFESEKHNKDWYFSESINASKKLDKVCADSNFFPIKKVITTLSKTYEKEAKVAEEPEYGKYFAGLVRQINQSALLHADFAALDAPGWKIGNIESQLSWNIYITTPTQGGDCIVYNKFWDSSCESKKIPNSYGYDKSLIENCIKKAISPRCGDLWLFNSRNFHEVKEASGERISISSFVGKLPNQDIILWS